MNERKKQIYCLYRNINKLDRQIISLNQKEQTIIKKISKGKEAKTNYQYVDLAEDTIEKIEILEKKKVIMLSTMADITPMVEIDLLEDPYMENILNNGDANKKDIIENYLYGSIAYGYIVFSSKKVPNINKKMTLAEFETKEPQKKLSKKNKNFYNK